MSNQTEPILIDVPPNPTRLEAWKQANGIQTALRPIDDAGEDAWVAWRHPHRCRSETEEAACVALAKALGIPGPWDSGGLDMKAALGKKPTGGGR